MELHSFARSSCVSRSIPLGRVPWCHKSLFLQIMRLSRGLFVSKWIRKLFFFAVKIFVCADQLREHFFCVCPVLLFCGPVNYWFTTLSTASAYISLRGSEGDFHTTSKSLLSFLFYPEGPLSMEGSWTFVPKIFPLLHRKKKKERMHVRRQYPLFIFLRKFSLSRTHARTL